MLRLLAHLVLRPVLAVLVLGVLAAFGLALRLSVSPIDVTWLVHAVTPLPLGGDRQSRPARPPQGRLEVGRAQLAWQGFRNGPSAPIVVRLADVAIRRPNGTIVDHIDRIRISLLPAGLLRGRLSIVEIGVSGARLNLRRDPVRGLDLGLAPAAQQYAGGGSSGPQLQWDALKRVHVADMQLAVHDLVVGRDWAIRNVDIDVRPPLAGRRVGAFGDADRGGIVGRFGATLLMAGRHVVLRGDGSALVATTPGEVVWHMTLDPVVPSDLAASLQGVGPDLSPLRIAALPVAPVLDVTFENGPGQFMEPRRAALSARLGRGEIRTGPTLRVEAGMIRLQASLSDDLRQAVTLRLLRADLQLRDAADPDAGAATGPFVHAEGTLSTDQLSDPRRIRASLTADIPRVGFAGLSQYWPDGAALGARRWITANITAGEATGLHVEDTLASDTGWDGLVETGRTGGFDASALTLWWLRPIAPLHDMQARLTFQGPDAVLVEAPHAVMPVDGGHPGANRAGGGARPRVIDVSNGSMRITGLGAEEQIATVTARLTGDLGDLLTELGNPRLHLLSRHPIPFTHPSGHAVTDFTLTLPLDDNVTIGALKVGTHAQLTGVHLGDVAAGRALNRARLSLSATTDGLAVSGTGAVGTIPARFDYAMDFRDGPPDQVTEQAHVAAAITTAALRREGLDPSDNVAGSGRLALAYAAHRSGAATVALGFDLTDLAIDTQVWSKARGQAAEAAAVIGLQRGRLTSIDRIHAAGPGLLVDAHASIAGGRARGVVVGRFTLGRSSGAGRIELPGVTARGQPPAPILVQVRGPALDLATAISGSRRTLPQRPGLRPARKAPPAQPWIADLAFDRIYVTHDAALSGFSAHVEDDGSRIALARLQAAGPTPVSIRVTPDQAGRHVVATAGDSGRLLQGLGVTSALAGGALHLDGQIADDSGGTTVRGRVEIGRFVVLDAPVAARIARNVSLYGWLGALPAPQLGVDHLVAPFTLRGQVVTLSDARAHDPALGVTLHGPIDLGHQTLDLNGTVVPAWAINQLPGRLPLIGRLFSPETGGGVVAATISIHGPFAAPDVHVNALSTLAPGFLRRLLFE